MARPIDEPTMKDGLVGLDRLDGLRLSSFPLSPFPFPLSSLLSRRRGGRIIQLSNNFLNASGLKDMFPAVFYG